MKNKKKLLFLIFTFIILFTYKNTYAFDSSNYKYRTLCGTYEVAGFHTDGYIDKVACFNDFDSAKNYMVSNGADDLAILHKVNGETIIVDANVALLDLTVNPDLTYFYLNSELTGYRYTYMDTGSLYGGVDGVHMATGYSNTYGTWTAKVQIGNFTGWIEKKAYEIVPITWIRSTSNYSVTDEIRHNYVAKIQNDYYGSAGRVIGPKPEMLNKGLYFSYDGHYFYTNLTTLIKDVKNNSHSYSVNPYNPYYNYYMYLSNHTKTTYSSVNIDEYIRNNMGFYENVYGNAASNNTSRLYGMGTFFYYAQQKYGVNAINSLSLSRNETGNGRSNLSINKNNGFGLNAVDTNPTQAANWYASFQSSILGYASKWITYGFAHPRDWRYFGPQFGDKWIGMNVKYASDTYWGEKNAANYYSFDKAFGLQDYNYYQLGVVTGPTNAYSGPGTNYKFIYQYPEKEDGVVIVDEVMSGNEKWYKVVSDLNIDYNYNEITSGDYNWNNFVYVPANQVVKINNAKYGYKYPNSVTEYQDAYYTYDLLIENTELKPRVAISTKDTPYHFDSSLQARTGETLLKDRYVMVFTIAYSNGVPVAYLVTSDYFHDQKHWVSADSIRLINATYGKVTVDVEGNQYTWVNYNTEDKAYSKISGLYTYTYVPILGSQVVGNDTWLTVPVNLKGYDNIFGYTLQSFPGVYIELSTSQVANTAPVIQANDIEVFEGQSINPNNNVTAYDQEDGDITNNIQIIENTVNTTVPGEYKITYQVIDSSNTNTVKTIRVLVKENKAPEIEASDKTISKKDDYNPLDKVKAYDYEDGDLTSKIKVIKNEVTKTSGSYEVIYEVEDSLGKKTTKQITVTVLENYKPEILVEDKTIYLNEEFDPLKNVSAKDHEDGDLTDKLVVKTNNVDTTKEGTYEVTYEVEDSDNEKTTKTITVTVKEKVLEEANGEFYLDSLTFNKTTKKFEIAGYLTILDHNNSKDKKYELIFKDKNTGNEYRKEINAWNKDYPYDLGTYGNNSYTYSWFKGNINFSNIPNGDYELYMQATDDLYYTTQVVDNLFNKAITKRGEDDNKGYNFKVLLNLKSKKMELSIRDELYTTYEAPTFRAMVNDFEDISLNDSKLSILGYSYNYKATYASEQDITRTLIVENTTTFKQYYFDLGSKIGPYSITTSDNLDKSYIWYQKEIDLKDLPKGTYSVLVYTKTKDARDYGELTDVLGILPKLESTSNDKKYSVSLNKQRQNRVEITVE